MRCSKARRLISDYIDHGLKMKRSSALEHHLQGCSDCRKLLEDFKGIVEGAQDLERFSPSTETWFKIKAGLKPATPGVPAHKTLKSERLPGLFSPPRLKYALAGSFILLVLIASLVTFGLRYWQGNRWTIKNSQDYAISKLEEAERHYKLAIKALIEAAAFDRENLDPQLVEVFKRNLEVIDTSINACRQAVLNNPDNIELRNYLLEAYRKKVDVLDRMRTLESKTSLKIGPETSL